MSRTSVLMIVTAALAFGPARAQNAGQLHRATLSVSALGGGAYLVTGGVTNTGFIVGESGVVAIDPQMFPFDAAQEISDIARVTSKPVRTIILTHSDVDHVNGLPAWPRGVAVIAQENARPEIEAELAGKAPPTATPVPVPERLADYLPTHLVRRSETVRIDGVDLVLSHLAAGHTDSDLVVYLPAQKIAFVGDLLTIDDPNLPNSGPYPVIHREKYGSSLGWIRVMKALLRLDADRFIGGHGPAPLTRAQVADALAATEQRRTEIQRLFDQGLSLAEIKVRLKDPIRTGPLASFPTFVDSTYQELLH